MLKILHGITDSNKQPLFLRVYTQKYTHSQTHTHTHTHGAIKSGPAQY